MISLCTTTYEAHIKKIKPEWEYADCDGSQVGVGNGLAQAETKLLNRF